MQPLPLGVRGDKEGALDWSPAVKVRHERPQSDLSFQIQAPRGLRLVTGEVVRIAQWSLDGFRFPDDSDVLPKKAVLSIPFQGVDIQFPVRLARQGQDRFLAFEGLTGHQPETLSVFHRSILSGRMASTDEVITSLDCPVDLVPMEETEEERAAGPAGKSPRSLRAALTIVIYVILAAAVFWTLGTGIYAKISTIAIQHARIEAPLVDHVSGQNGYVDRIEVTPGDLVAAGDVLVRISTSKGEAALDAVRACIRTVEVQLDRARARVAQRERQIDQERAVWVAKIAATAPFGPSNREGALMTFEVQTSIDQEDLFKAYEAALRDAEDTETELRLLRRERRQLNASLDALNIIGVEASTVQDISVLDGQFVGRNMIVATTESVAARTARCRSDQGRATAIHLGMQVIVTLNAGNGREHLIGQIANIEARINPTLSSQFDLLIAADFPDLNAEQTCATLPHMMPVTLDVQRTWAGQIADQARALLPGQED